MTRLRIIFTLLWTLVMAGIVNADELTAEQKRFRSSLQSFLKEEGFMPTIDDSDNSLNFKKEGTLYWFTFGGGSPIYLEFYRAGLTTEEANKTKVLEAVNEGNRKVRCAKAIYTGKSIVFSIEMYCHSVEEFKYIFYKCIKELDNIKDKVVDYYND